MIAFAHRNLKIFFRDRSAVFFSLLSSLIIVGLYVLFLGDVYVGNFPNVSNARELLDNWVMAGLLATTAVTGGIGAFSVKIDDRARKIEKDFLSSPVARAHLDAGYLLGALVVDILLCLFTLLLAEAYIVLNGGRWLSFPVLCRLLMMIVAACVAGVMPAFCRRERRISQTARRVCGSRPVVGSSRKSTFGAWINARAISARRLWPPERLPYRRLRRSARCISSSARRQAWRRGFPPCP